MEKTTYNALGHELALHVTGDRSSVRVLFFLPGWPDDHRCVSEREREREREQQELKSTSSVFDPLAERLATEGKYLCATACLPNFDECREGQGFDWAQIAEAIKAGVEKLLSLSTCGASKVTLVQHDWGSFAGFHFNGTYPEMVEDIVALDVLTGFGRRAREEAKDKAAEVLHTSPENEYSFGGQTCQGLIHVHYQLWFALAHIAGSRLGDWAGNAVLGFALRYCFYWPTAYVFHPSMVSELPLRPWSELQWTQVYPWVLLRLLLAVCCTVVEKPRTELEPQNTPPLPFPYLPFPYLFFPYLSFPNLLFRISPLPRITFIGTQPRGVLYCRVTTPFSDRPAHQCRARTNGYSLSTARTSARTFTAMQISPFSSSPSTETTSG